MSHIGHPFSGEEHNHDLDSPLPGACDSCVCVCVCVCVGVHVCVCVHVCVWRGDMCVHHEFVYANVCTHVNLEIWHKLIVSVLPANVTGSLSFHC